MKNSIISIFLSLLVLSLVSCKDDDNDFILNDFHISIATVENLNQSSNFLFRLDDNTLMFSSSSSIPFYIPKDGQRIIANYSIISKMARGSIFDYSVKLNDAYSVLTKTIFSITKATQDSIGNDSVVIDDIWIGSDYLNVKFLYTGYNKVHFINLVSDTSKIYSDGKIHLEFRHNANGDVSSFYKSGIVSFNLKSLKSMAVDSKVNLMIHVNIPNQAEDRIYPLIYTINSNSVQYNSKKMLFSIGEAGLTR
jgi:hypothetical protein